MNIVAKQIDRSNTVIILPDQAAVLPEVQAIAALYRQEDLANVELVDDAVMKVRVLGIPKLKFRYIFEPKRMRLEDEGFRKPALARLAAEAWRVARALFPGVSPVSYGFNYDLIYRSDTVIPQREVMKSFVKPDLVENVADFGWQFTLKRPKSQDKQVYFFKAVSPLELSVHANFHFVRPLPDKPEELQKEFERCYDDIDSIMSHLTF